MRHISIKMADTDTGFNNLTKTIRAILFQRRAFHIK